MADAARASKRRKTGHIQDTSPIQTPPSLRKSTRRQTGGAPNTNSKTSARQTPTRRAQEDYTAVTASPVAATAKTPTRRSTRRDAQDDSTVDGHVGVEEEPTDDKVDVVQDVTPSARGSRSRKAQKRRDEDLQHPVSPTSTRGKKGRLKRPVQHGDAGNGIKLRVPTGNDDMAMSEDVAEPRGEDTDMDAQGDQPPEVREAPEILPATTTSITELTTPTQYDIPRRIALCKLTARRAVPLQLLTSQRTQVHQLLSSTVTAGQGNSLLLLGSRGAGKSALVDSVISELALEPLNTATDGSPNFHVIRLNGFIETDDKLALREIWRQLGREMEIDEDEGKGRNYADTLASLLALLSHPTELAAQMAGADQMDVDGQAASNDRISNAVIFLISEFDAFAARPRQTLLYNLFDIAQSRKAPIAVLGMSTRMDCAEMLEKRVKSRFSHRYIHVPAPPSFDGFLVVCRAAITISPDELRYDEQQSLASAPPSTLETWNAAARSLLDVDTANSLRTPLEQIYHITRSVPTAFSILHLPVATLSPSPAPSSPAVAYPLPLAPLTSSKLAHIPSLPALSLALLIAAARLPLLTDSDTISFPLAYDEYRSLATKARLAASSGGVAVHGGVAGRVWGREIARGAWEGLVDAGLVLQEEGGGVGGMGMCRVDVALEEIEPAMGGEMEKSMGRWCREL